MVAASIVGGITPYSLLWNDSAASTTDSLSNVPASQYVLVVTDSIGCVTSDTVEVLEPDSSLTLSTVSISHVSSYKGSDGEATVAATGGVPPYQLEWNESFENRFPKRIRRLDSSPGPRSKSIGGWPAGWSRRHRSLTPTGSLSG